MQTQHAAKRSQQRGIPPLVQNWLLDYGEENFNERGLIVRFFTAKSIRNMERDFGREPLRRLSEYLRCYLIESADDGSIITIGKRHKHTHIWRH
jgi:hypothetical protein